MKSTDLRIGNLVVYDCNDELPSIDYEKHEIETIKAINYSDWFGEGKKYWLETNHLEGELLDEFKPIPITTEWLEKFGFEKQNGVYVKKYCETNQIRCHIVNDKLSLCLDEFCEIEGRYSVNLGFLQYVHQLQNLYYGVTISELEFVN